jgi:hypothetical protein
MAGRPTKYKPEYVDQVEKLCKLGATDKEIADFFDVTESTLNEWKKAYQEFSVSLKAGKLIADAMVAEKLFQRATGFTHPEIDIKMYEGKIIKTPIIKQYPPDSTAAIFWLKNRKPEQWRDKQEIHHTLPEKQVMEIGGQKVEF